MPACPPPEVVPDFVSCFGLAGRFGFPPPRHVAHACLCLLALSCSIVCVPASFGVAVAHGLYHVALAHAVLGWGAYEAYKNTLCSVPVSSGALSCLAWSFAASVVAHHFSWLGSVWIPSRFISSRVSSLAEHSFCAQRIGGRWVLLNGPLHNEGSSEYCCRVVFLGPFCQFMVCCWLALDFALQSVGIWLASSLR